MKYTYLILNTKCFVRVVQRSSCLWHLLEVQYKFSNSRTFKGQINLLLVTEKTHLEIVTQDDVAHVVTQPTDAKVIAYQPTLYTKKKSKNIFFLFLFLFCSCSLSTQRIILCIFNGKLGPTQPGMKFMICIFHFDIGFLHQMPWCNPPHLSRLGTGN